ncbi:hypothetical protein PHYBOEH_011870 [Phytophthora boehmeriae]|uniref:Uncharacterized protein n=1 Tax=Phytophthora boehmeriae TaxID=109152 RepID=A0A8T1VHG4_9STRA|nr:hypothetical protein PHYBOEH_011870 [Phytophthora boehmeriae]
MQNLELPPHHPPTSYVHRLELSGHCNISIDSSENSLDLSNLLSDAEALHQLVDDLFRQFEALHVDQIVALQVVKSQSRGDKNKDKASVGNQSVSVAPEAYKATHPYTCAIAGAIAAAKQLGELQYAVAILKELM